MINRRGNGKNEQDYSFWQDRILEILGISRDVFLQGGSLDHPFFLVPSHDGLESDEARELLATIRYELLGSGEECSVSHVSEVISKMTPLESLPLLYAMRHIAREGGSLARYWPEFHDQLLGSHLKLSEVQVRLAPRLSNLWLRLWVHTRGALYLPSIGRRHIRWPLAHAGLLQGDQQMLSLFGGVLFRAYEGNDGEAPLNPDLLDEFLIEFKNWIHNNNAYKSYRLAQLILKEDGTDFVIGELAQSWISERWDNLKGISQSEAKTVSGISVLRSSLTYNVGRNKLYIRLKPNVKWNGRVNPHLRWGEERIDIHTVYIESEDETRGLETTLVLTNPTWEDTALLVIGSSEDKVRLPRPPKNEGLVFKALSGQRIRHWEPGGEYYVLLPKRRISKRRLDSIFTSLSILGSPDGQWDDYQLLWTEVLDPVKAAKDSGREAVTLDVVNSLDEATDYLGLPKLGHIFQPHLRLFGGTFLTSHENFETYDTSSPPFLAVSGIWDRPLTVILKKRDARKAETTLEGKLTLPSQPTYDRKSIKLFERQELAPGQYIIEASNTPQTHFELVKSAAKDQTDRFLVYLSLESDGEVVRNSNLGLRDLNKSVLVVSAWPLAELSLNVVSENLSRRLLLRADEKGEYRLHASNLGLEASIGGRLTITASWHGLIEASLVFSDQPYVSHDEIVTKWKSHNSQMCLVATFKVRNAGSANKARVIVIGKRPWDTDIRETEVRINDKNRSQCEVFCEKPKADWLIILSTNINRDTEVWYAGNINRSETIGLPAKLNLRDFEGASWDKWDELLYVLDRVRLPPKLRDLLIVSRLGHFILGQSLPKLLMPTWIIVKPDILKVDNDLYRQLLKSSSQTRAMFHAIDSEDSKADSIVRCLNSHRMRQDSVGALRKLHVDGKGTAWLSYLECCPMTCRVSILDSEDQFRVKIRTMVAFHRCSKCGETFLPAAFWRHLQPGEKTLCSSSDSQGSTVIPPGEQVFATLSLATQVDSRAIFDYIVDTISKALKEEPVIPEKSKEWLDALVFEFSNQDLVDEPQEWVNGLIETLTDVVDFVRSYSVDSETLVNLGHRVQQYEKALKVVFEWIDSECRKLV